MNEFAIESRELSDLRRDTLAAESFLASEHEAPKEVEQVDESDSWPMGRCICCGERAKIPPMQHCCLGCLTYEPNAERSDPAHPKT